MSSEEPIIGIPFSEFLEYALENLDHAEVKRPYHAALLLAADPEEHKIHVEFPDQQNSLKVPVVWRIKAWRESYQKLTRLREISEIERQWRFSRDEMLEELALSIHEVMGAEMSWCHEKADRIYVEKNIKAAKVFGCYKLQEVIDSKPESLKGKVEIRL